MKRTIKFILLLLLSVIGILHMYETEVEEVKKEEIEIVRVEQESLTEDVLELSEEKRVYRFYSTCRLNVRESNDTNSQVVRVLNYSEQVTGFVEGDWLRIDDGFVYCEYLTDEHPTYTDYSVPDNEGFKSFMPYEVNGSSIFSSRSRQFTLQKVAYTGESGIRMVSGRYCVAIGSYFSVDIGQYFDIVLENGTVIPCILSDGKADCDTDDSNIITLANGCMTEFIVDMSRLNDDSLSMGDVSYSNDGWNSPISYIRMYDKNYFN